MLRAEPGLVSALKQNAQFLHKEISAISGLTVTSCELSPIVHVGLADHDATDARSILRSIALRCAREGVALTASTYIPSEKFPPPPTLRITTNALHSRDQLVEAVKIIQEATAAQLMPVPAAAAAADDGGL
ncbi:unnamed protein product [Sphacelaria rigidula]